MKIHYPLIGSVSHGTLRYEDLIPVFALTLEALVLPVCRDDDLNALLNDCDVNLSTLDPVDANCLVNELIDELSAFAPPFTYFGSHPGDASDFGFWIDEDAINDAEEDDLLKAHDLAEVPEDYIGYVLITSDHGNRTLYSLSPADTSLPRITTEIWSVV